MDRTYVIVRREDMEALRDEIKRLPDGAGDYAVRFLNALLALDLGPPEIQAIYDQLGDQARHPENYIGARHGMLLTSRQMRELKMEWSYQHWFVPALWRLESIQEIFP